MVIKLFIATDNPYYSWHAGSSSRTLKPRDSVCIAARKKGEINWRGQIIMPEMTPGGWEPTLDVIIPDHEVRRTTDPRQFLVSEAQEQLGDAVAEDLRKCIVNNRMFAVERTTSFGLTTISYGVYLPDIWEQARSPVKYGTLSPLSLDEILKMERRAARAVKQVPARVAAKQGRKSTHLSNKFLTAIAQRSPRSMVTMVTLNPSDLSEDDNAHAKAVLEHFIEKERKRLSRIKEVHYARGVAA